VEHFSYKMPIPSITEQDLINFHHAHFPSAPLPSNFFRQATEGEIADDSPFGLGYYHDGVPRTLTDEEISFLREREIQLLLKKRRLKRERSERKEDRTLSEKALPELQTTQGASTTLSRDLEEDHTTVESLDSMAKAGEGASTGTSEERTIALSSGTGGTFPNTKTANSLKRKQKRETQELRKKSKIQSSSSCSEQFTPRRVARELDDSTEAPVELDY
jgi:hypothetical protein